MARTADLAIPVHHDAPDAARAQPLDRETLICAVTENSARATTAFAAALARSHGWRLALCPVPSGPVREQLEAVAAAAAREDAALAVVPRSTEPGWVDAFLEVSATAPCPLVAIVRD